MLYGNDFWQYGRVMFNAIFIVVAAGMGGFMLSLSPIPYLWLMIWHKFRDELKSEGSVSAAMFLLINGLGIAFLLL